MLYLGKSGLPGVFAQGNYVVPWEVWAPWGLCPGKLRCTLGSLGPLGSLPRETTLYLGKSGLPGVFAQGNYAVPWEVWAPWVLCPGKLRCTLGSLGSLGSLPRETTLYLGKSGLLGVFAQGNYAVPWEVWAPWGLCLGKLRCTLGSLGSLGSLPRETMLYLGKSGLPGVSAQVKYPWDLCSGKLPLPCKAWAPLGLCPGKLHCTL